MLRSSYSQILNSSRDFSIALCDARCRLVAQADHIPVHVGAMPWAARAVAEAFPDCARGRHLPAQRPLPRRQPPSRPHHPRAGLRRRREHIRAPLLVGGAGAPERHRRRHAWRLQPGRHRDLAGRPSRAADPPRRGRRAARGPPADAGGQHAHSARLPWRSDGDGRRRAARSRKAAAAAREARRREAWTRRSAPSSTSRKRMRGASSRTGRTAPGRARPSSTTTASAARTSRSAPRVTKRGDALTVDLSESDEQATGFVNSVLPEHAQRRVHGLRLPARPGGGEERRRLPPAGGGGARGHRGLGAGGRAGDACAPRHCSNEIVEAIIRAMQHCCPDRAMGGWGRRFRVAIQGRDERRPGRGFVWHLFHARPGGGGSAGGDGWSTARRMALRGRPEIRQRRDGRGALPPALRAPRIPPRLGRRRPAPRRPGRRPLPPGRERRPLPRQHRRRRRAPRRRRHASAAADGAPHDYRLRRADGEERRLRTKEVGITVEPGDRLLVRSGGGGGWGHPARRDPAARERDRREGYA